MQRAGEANHVGNLADSRPPSRHFSDDDFELYALDRMAEADAAPVEEHLLVCEECGARLAG
jgi:hypothetical protein